MRIMMSDKTLDLESFIKIDDYKYRKYLGYSTEEELILKHNVPEEKSFKFLELTKIESYGEILNVDIFLNRGVYKQKQKRILVLETIHLGIFKFPFELDSKIKDIVNMLNQFEDL